MIYYRKEKQYGLENIHPHHKYLKKIPLHLGPTCNSYSTIKWLFNIQEFNNTVA